MLKKEQSGKLRHVNYTENWLNPTLNMRNFLCVNTLNDVLTLKGQLWLRWSKSSIFKHMESQSTYCNRKNIVLCSHTSTQNQIKKINLIMKLSFYDMNDWLRSILTHMLTAQTDTVFHPASWTNDVKLQMKCVHNESHYQINLLLVPIISFSQEWIQMSCFEHL